MATEQSNPERRASQAGRKKPYHRPKIVIFGSIQSLPDVSQRSLAVVGAESFVEPDDHYSHPLAEDFAVLTQ